VPDHDEAVNVDLEPEDALRVLLGEERRERDPDAEDAGEPEADE
jgi:hypothetical protein